MKSSLRLLPILIGLSVLLGVAAGDGTSSPIKLPMTPEQAKQISASWAKHLGTPVLTVGQKGQWDDQTLGCFSVLWDAGTYYLYFGGARYGRPKNVGMATSRDGVHWSKSAMEQVCNRLKGTSRQPPSSEKCPSYFGRNS